MTFDQAAQLIALVEYSVKALAGIGLALIVAVTWKG